MKTELIKKVAETMQMVSDNIQYYYNRKTDEFVCVMPDYMSEEESEDIEDHWKDYVPLPSQYEIHEYEMMDEFARRYPDEDISERLCNALCGRGAFRRFKDAVNLLGIREAWFSFRDSKYHELAKEWCEEHNLLND